MSSVAFDGQALLQEQNDLLTRASTADIYGLQFLRLRLSAQQQCRDTVLHASSQPAPSSPPQPPEAALQDSPDPTIHNGAVHNRVERHIRQEESTPTAPSHTSSNERAANIAGGDSEPRISRSSVGGGDEVATSVSYRSSTQPTTTTASVPLNTKSETTTNGQVPSTAAVTTYDQLPASVVKRRSILGNNVGDSDSVNASHNKNNNVNNESTLDAMGGSSYTQHANTMNGANNFHSAALQHHSFDERPAIAMNGSTTGAQPYAELPLPVVEQALVPCPSCGRKFLPESLRRHQPPCERQRERETRRRRDAEARERRPHTTTTETLSVTMSSTSFLQHGSQQQSMARLASTTAAPGRLSRRQSLAESVASDQAAAAAVLMGMNGSHTNAAAMKNETSVGRQSKWRQQSLQLRSALAGTTSAAVEDDRMQCPYCGRRFTADAAVRHIPLCFEKTKWPTHRK